jgi:hypothetical protein
MKLQTLAIAAALTAAAASSAFAMDRTVVRETPNGTVVKHVERHGDVKRVRIVRHDRDWRAHRTVVIHRRTVPMRHVVIREYHHHRPGYVVNRHVTVVHRYNG